jgi:hypothetical protein
VTGGQKAVADSAFSINNGPVSPRQEHTRDCSRFSEIRIIVHMVRPVFIDISDIVFPLLQHLFYKEPFPDSGPCFGKRIPLIENLFSIYILMKNH